MPVYTYRREDGTTFDYRQKFTDDALTVDPETGQAVVRLVQAAGIIFKGTGFYVNDSKSASKSSISTPAKSSDSNSSSESSSKSEGESAPKSEAKSDNSSEKSEKKDAKPAEPKKSPAPAAAD